MCHLGKYSPAKIGPPFTRIAVNDETFGIIRVCDIGLSKQRQHHVSHLINKTIPMG